MTMTHEINETRIGGLTPSQYRRALGRVPTSVVIAATISDGAPVGMVIGTFASVSLNPPLVGFFGDLKSKTLVELLRRDAWSFSVLNQNDLPVVEAFRGPQEHRFDQLDWAVSAHQTPHLANAILTIDTVSYAITDAGDHKAVLAEVVDVIVGDHIARPLVFQAGRLARLDPGQMVDRELWQLGWDV